VSSGFGGFAIRGFRSFYRLQRIRLPGRLNVLAGENNSGKSNVLLAADRFLGPFSKAHGNAPSVDVLDRSQVGDGEPGMPLTVGVALRLDGSPLESFEHSIGKSLERGTQGAACMEQFCQLVVESSGENDDGLLWFDWTAQDGGGFVPDADQVQSISSTMETSGRKVVFNQIVLDLLNQNSGTTEANVSALLSSWTDKIQIPEVVLIPAQRQITRDGDVSPDLRNFSGGGFTGLLQALQAPAAHTYRQDRARFEKINRFLKKVLDDDSAEIAIPYDSSTVHVNLSGRVLPLHNLGSGIEQVVLLATVATRHDGCLFCIEEPELHLHPILLRKLTQYLLGSTSNIYLFATHSAHLMDAPDANILSASYDTATGTTVQQLVDRGSRAALSQRLGYRASDLVQSNAVVWVEGPSDRIYIRHWISKVNPDLLEGIHYSILFYAGRLLSHYSGNELGSLETSVGDFISMLDVNRNMAVVIDSDRKDSNQEINATKTRLVDEFNKVGAVAWVTVGREIENYVPPDIFAAAVEQVHPTVSASHDDAPNEFASRFTFVTTTGDTTAGKIHAPDKVRIASVATELDPSLWDILDLVPKVTELVRFIEKANNITTA
jgi:hypothetical protein